MTTDVDKMTRTAAKKKAIADAQAKAKVEREAKLAAVVVDFEKNYGRDESKLVAWQMLCTDVGKEAGTSIRQCKKVRRCTRICPEVLY